MYDIQFYQDNRGYIPAINFLEQLDSTGCKKDRDRIESYIDRLERFGDKLLSNNKIAKYLENGIYELKPGRYRVLYSKLDNNTYVILHIHIKTDKADQNRHIKQASRELQAHNQ